MDVPRCERCFERGWTRPSNPQNGSAEYGGEPLCDDCLADVGEAVDEQRSVWRDAPAKFAANH
jgi:hypothetical protein